MNPFLGTIVSKQVFNKVEDESYHYLMIIVLVTRYGKFVELKSTNENKIDVVYGRFSVGDVVEVETNQDSLQPCEPKFSDALGELYSWSISKVNPSCFTQFKIIRCNVSIQNYYMNTNKPVCMAGLYLSFTKSIHAKKFCPSGTELIAQGYYVKLMDINGLIFQVLVWRNVNFDSKNFSLFKCNRNTVVVILNAREQDERYEQVTPSGYYTLTTTYPPVVDPKCFSPESRERFLELREDLPQSQMKAYYPNRGRDHFEDEHVGYCGIAIAM